MAAFSQIKITAPGPTGIGTIIEIDGERKNLVTSIELKISTHEENRLVIDQWFPGTKPGDIVLFEGNCEVDQIYSFPDQPDKKYRLVEVE